MADDQKAASPMDAASADAPQEAGLPVVYRHPRLNELARLEANWDSYGAPPLTEASLTAADRLVFIPTGYGGVQIELHSGGREVEVTINEDGVIEAAWVSGGVDVEQ